MDSKVLRQRFLYFKTISLVSENLNRFFVEAESSTTDSVLKENIDPIRKV